MNNDIKSIGITIEPNEIYWTQDKRTWGDGAWQNEPDKMVWVDKATNLDCMVHRNHHGSWCGYVGIPENHPYFDTAQEDDSDLSVHGGITFGGLCAPGDDPSHGICHIAQEGRPERVYWLGFDCGHAFDYAPAMEAQIREIAPDLAMIHDEYRQHAPTGWRDVYRDLAYVVAECESLAGQLAVITA